MTDRFDEAYYRRYYEDPDTRVADDVELANLGAFVCAYTRYLDIDVDRVLDMGCGLGRWKTLIADHYPDATYTGVEVSEYVAERCGWINASVTSFSPDHEFDLVICQDVFQYLTDAEAREGIANFGEWCTGVLFFAALTEDDWENNVDQRLTDSDAYLRTGQWYLTELRKFFVPIGGSLFVHKDADVVLFELEHG